MSKAVRHFLRGLSKGRQRAVPVVLQLNTVECGLACLTMVVRYFGGGLELHECRRRCPIGRDGVSSGGLMRAARDLNLSAQAVSILDIARLHSISLPAILHWSFNHFVVLERILKDGAVIVDPGSGRRTITKQELSNHFTGVALLCEPAAGFERRPRVRRPSWWVAYASYLPRNGHVARLALQVVAASALLQVTVLAFPLFTTLLVDRVIPQQLRTAIPLLGAGMLCVVVAQSCTRWLRALVLSRLQAQLDSALTHTFLEHLLRLPLSFFLERSRGDLVMRVASNAQIRDSLSGQLLAVIVDGGFLLIYIIAVTAWSPSFAATIGLFGALQAAIVIFTSRAARRVTEEYLAAQAACTSHLVQALNGMSALKASGAETVALQHWNDIFDHQLTSSVRRSALAGGIDAALSSSRALPQLAIMWMGTWYVLSGRLTLGTMLGLSALASSMLMPLGSIVSGIQQWQVVRVSIERLLDVLRSSPEQEGRIVRPAPVLRGEVEVRNVSFRYHPGAPYVLRDVSFTVRPGQRIAIVGSTGSGKSTLMRVLLGLYEPTSGGVWYDGLPLADLDYRSVRSQIGTVTQESPLMGESVRRNISFARTDATMEQIRSAARLALIDDDVSGMPLGYETLISEDGGAISGGQRQRIALARALLARPTLLYLDEATSSLDEVTERTIHRNLQALDSTRIVVSHRLHLAADADVIVVLESGLVTAAGRHDEVIRSDNWYARSMRGRRPQAVAECGLQERAAIPAI